jgi:SH3-like domain-containing protein
MRRIYPNCGQRFACLAMAGSALTVASLLFYTLLGAPLAHAGPLDATQPAKLGGSGLPIPRFVSLRASEVNMRKGPGENFPIDWIYKREGLPVQVIAEFGDWRQVVDMDGAKGWMLGNLLSDQRTAVIIGTVRTLYAQPTPDAKPVWRVEPGVVAKIVVCEDAWCQLNIQGKSGWVLRDHIWGVNAGENFD